jgi:hypothetical protein
MTNTSDDQSFDSDPSAVLGFNPSREARDPVACPLCDEQFVVRVDLEAHLLAAHGVADKTKVHKPRTTKRRRSHYKSRNTQATSFRGAFIAFMVVLLFGTIVIGIANPGSLKVLLPAVIIIDAAIYVGLVRG